MIEWFLALVWLAGALTRATWGYLALKIAERPHGWREWAWWILYCVLWFFPAAAGTYGFFTEDSED